MRRQVALVLMLAAFVALAAWLRPRRVPVPHVAAASQQVQATVEEKEEVPIDTSAPPPPTATVPKTNPPRPASGKIVRAPERECAITVITVAGEVVPGAAVLILTHSYGRPSSGTKMSEHRTDHAGQAPLKMGAYDTADVFAYKVGVGAGASGTISSQTEGTVRLKASPNLDLWCLGPHDVPLEGAEIVLTTEVLYPGRLDAYGSRTVISIPLPARKFLTRLDGSGRFETVFPPVEFKEGSRAAPGLRLVLEADWNRLTAHQTIDKPLDGPVKLYPE